MIEQQVLRAAQQVEDQIDSELHRLENMDDDDIERLRQKRMDELKRCGGGAAGRLQAAHRRRRRSRRRRLLADRASPPFRAPQAAAEATGVGAQRARRAAGGGGEGVFQGATSEQGAWRGVAPGLLGRHAQPHATDPPCLDGTLQEMKGEERMVCLFYRNSLPCQARAGAAAAQQRGIAPLAWPPGKRCLDGVVAAPCSPPTHACPLVLHPPSYADVICNAPGPPQVMDKHLTVLAARHLETKFVKVQAEKAPFLTGGWVLVAGGC